MTSPAPTNSWRPRFEIGAESDARARVARRRRPRAVRVAGRRLRDGSGALQPGDDDAAGSRASSADYDDEEREAVVHFLAAAASPVAPGRARGRPARRLAEARDGGDDRVAQDRAQRHGGGRRGHPGRSRDARGVPAASGSFVPWSEAPETPTGDGADVRRRPAWARTCTCCRTRSTRGACVRCGKGSARETAATRRRPELESYREKERTAADRRDRAARARLSDALRAVASSLVSCSGDPARSDRVLAIPEVRRGELDPDAAEVAEAIASVWQACDAASAGTWRRRWRRATRRTASGALSRALSRGALRRPPPTTGHANANTAVSVSRGGGRRRRSARCSRRLCSRRGCRAGTPPPAVLGGAAPHRRRDLAAQPGRRERRRVRRRCAPFAAAAAAPQSTRARPRTCIRTQLPPKPGGRDRRARGARVVSRLALASLRRARGDRARMTTTRRKSRAPAAAGPCGRHLVRSFPCRWVSIFGEHGVRRRLDSVPRRPRRARRRRRSPCAA